MYLKQDFDLQETSLVTLDARNGHPEHRVQPDPSSRTDVPLRSGQLGR